MELSLLIPGRSKEAPDGPLCPWCGKGKGYLIRVNDELRHVKCWQVGPVRRTGPPDPGPRLFDP